MMDRLTAEQIEELERLRDDRNSADPDRYIGAGTRFQLALDNYSDALLAAARANAALRRECEVVRKVKEYKEGQEKVVRGRCGVAALTVAANLVDEAVAEQEAARAETDRLGALEGA